MNRDELLAFIEKTSAEVAKMPAWKRGLLEASMKPMNDEPRKPITTKERAMKIEGVPEGWELIRIGRPEKGEHFLDGNNMPDQAEHDGLVMARPILRKVERPKQYRPFANAEEFKPHRDRWVRYVEGGITRRIVAYSETEVVIIRQGSWGYDAAFASYVFDDGTPFGVEDESSGPPITRPAQTY